MTIEIQRGKKKFLFLFVSLITLSILTQIFAFTTYLEFSTAKIYVGILRLALMFGLLLAVYSGRSWARYLSIILFSIATFFLLIATIGYIKATLLGSIMIPILCLYCYAIYLLSWDKDFLAFFDYKIENSYL